MSIVDDYATIRADLESDHNRRALAALERIRAKHQLYLDACSRLTWKANALAANQEPGVRGDMRRMFAREVRDALGDAYLGGPLQ